MRKALAILGAAHALAMPALATASSSDEQEYHRHHLSIFLGGSAGHHEGFTGGLEYHYRINRWFSVGPSIEVTDAHYTPTLLIAVLNLHPWRDLKLIFGPGVEWLDGASELAVRSGVSWEFRFRDRYSIAPVYHADWSDSNWTHTIGVDFGIGF
jgi:hypothetical protein